ncbi:MAG TPA: hypothetical protein VIK86_07575 [Candidatus Paceibacterota bacterium]
MNSKVTDDQYSIEKIIFTYIFEHISEDLYESMIKYVMKESGETKESVNDIIEKLVHDKYIN